MGSSFSYKSNEVNQVIDNIRNISNKIPYISQNIKNSTTQMINAKGFQQYVSSMANSIFSARVDACEDYINYFVKYIREMQERVIAYSNNQEELNIYVNSLTEQEYEDFKKRMETKKESSVFEKAGNTLLNFSMSVGEGIGSFLETVSDGCYVALAGVASPFVYLYDGISGDDALKEMWDATNAHVSEKHVQNAMDSVYNDTEFGKGVKDNSYYYDETRTLGNNTGKAAASFALGAGLGEAFEAANLASQGGQFAASAISSVGKGTEKAWSEGASVLEGLSYGTSSAALGAFTKVGINELGDYVSDNIVPNVNFLGNDYAENVAVDIGSSVVKTGVDGAADPALQLSYKKYNTGDFGKDYQMSLQSNGGLEKIGKDMVASGFYETIDAYSDANDYVNTYSSNSDHFSQDNYEVPTRQVVDLSVTKDLLVGDVGNSQTISMDNNYKPESVTTKTPVGTSVHFDNTTNMILPAPVGNTGNSGTDGIMTNPLLMGLISNSSNNNNSDGYWSAAPTQNDSDGTYWSTAPEGIFD